MQRTGVEPTLNAHGARTRFPSKRCAGGAELRSCRMVEVYVRGHLAVECRARPSHPGADPGNGQAPRRPSVWSGRDQLEDSANPSAARFADQWGFRPRPLLANPAWAGAGATASPTGGEARALYAEFIIEPSRRLTDAWGHQAERPELSPISVVQRMRLTSSDKVIRVPSNDPHHNQAYTAPDRTFDDLGAHRGGG
jgi:hypothetical protein